MFPFLVEVITRLILILLLPPIQELIHWLILAGIHGSIAKSDVNDGVSLDLP